MVDMVDDDEKLKKTIFTSGQHREVWMLTENGLYEVLMQSRKPIAKEFKRGVKTILKEIRTNGGYVVTTEEDTPEVIMARALQVAQATIDRHKQRLQMAESTIEVQREQIAELAPKATYTDEVLQSTSTFTLTQVAHDLGLRSVHVLTKWLHEEGLLYKQSGQWQPSAKCATLGYFATRTARFVKSDESIGTRISTVVTESGRQYLHQLLRQRGAVGAQATSPKPRVRARSAEPVALPATQQPA